MKRNLSILQDHEIDLREIIKKFWNEKILILCISLFFMVAGYVYGSLQTKIYKTEIILRDAAPNLFEAYRPFINLPQPFFTMEQSQPQQGIAKPFNDELKLNLSSYDTLLKFVEKNNKINDFKNHAQISKIKFESVIDKINNIQNKYSFTYSEPLPGKAFLNDYIIFTQQMTIATFKEKLIQNILNEVNILQRHLEIAKSIDLEYPNIRSTIEGRAPVNNQDTLFYLGTKVLTKKILYLNKLVNDTKNTTFDYNPILEQATNPLLITKSPKIFAFLGLALGLFFSCIIIFVKNHLNN
jgi:LPS O-antigen subunit length determinant protein (WzzB/FepE family)